MRAILAARMPHSLPQCCRVKFNVLGREIYGVQRSVHKFGRGEQREIGNVQNDKQAVPGVA